MSVSPSVSEIRAQLEHPVLDGDGHWLEPGPVFLEYLDDAGGSSAVDRFRDFVNAREAWYVASAYERRRERIRRLGWWPEPADTLDRATAMLPGLLAERLEEFGIDCAVVFPTLGLLLPALPDESTRRAAVRALNTMTAKLLGPYAARLVPVATLSMHSPQEALDELEFASSSLGLGVVMINTAVPRRSEVMPNRTFIDTLGLDSNYDYDPFWRRVIELRVAPADHGGALTWPDRQSSSNYVYNHVGHFAEAHHAGCRGIFLGGVLRRFPTLKLAFLEGGVGWACNLLQDLMGHFDKRNPQALGRSLRPANLDLDRLGTLYREYADGAMSGQFEKVASSISTFQPFHTPAELTAMEGDVPDDFALAGITSADHLREEFCRNLYFGCEADDPMTAIAFDPRLNLPVKPIFSSDIGHWDVSDMSQVLVEAWESVEAGKLTREDFRAFTFGNGVQFFGGMNPRLFEPTAIADAARFELQPQ
jgi:Amidohydrolase